MGADPAVDAVAWVLAFPVRHAYAALWRVGLVEIVEPPTPPRSSRDRSGVGGPRAGAVAAAVVAAIAVSAACA